MADLIGVSGTDPIYGIQIGDIVIATHDKDQCLGKYCCIHNPSDHPLKDAPQNWRADRRLMERICVHGVGHPDPDDLSFKRVSMGVKYERYAFDVHGCDGCCRKVLSNPSEGSKIV
jgi:hypothetical protein